MFGKVKVKEIIFFLGQQQHTCTCNLATERTIVLRSEKVWICIGTVLSCPDFLRPGSNSSAATSEQTIDGVIDNLDNII